MNLNLADHWTQIMAYMAKDAIYRLITEEIDEMGNIIKRSHSDSTINAAISPVGFKTVSEAPGSWQTGDLCMYAYASLNLIGSDTTDPETKQGHIIYQGLEYKIEKINTAYDNEVAVIDKFRLRKVSIP